MCYSRLIFNPHNSIFWVENQRCFSFVSIKCDCVCLICLFFFLPDECSVDKSTGAVEVAHMISAGGAMNFLADETHGQFLEAAVYRLNGWRDVAAAATTQAVVMVASKKLRFARAGSVQSVFRELAVGTHLDGDWRRFCTRSKRQIAITKEMGGWSDEAADEAESNGDADETPAEYQFFCSEFVAACYQEVCAASCI
jgi:hypothetical protein